MNRKEIARIRFAAWVKEKNPDLFARAIQQAQGQFNSHSALSGLGEETSFWQKFTAGLTTLGTTYLSLKNQRDAMEINLARAEQGLDPIDAANSAPVVRTQIDMDPALAAKLASTAGEGINKTILMAGGLGLAALLLLKKR